MTLDPIERTSLALSLGATAVAGALATPFFALSLAAGAAMAAINFHAMRTSAVAVFKGELQNRMVWQALFAIRFLFLALAMGIATFAGVDPTGLAMGLSVVVPAALIEAWWNRPPIDPNAPALDADDEAWDRWNPWLVREMEPSEEDE
jgi:hypothetical protein